MLQEVDIREAASLAHPGPVLSIIVPVMNEEEAIPFFLDRVVRVVSALDDEAAKSFEILFVDDGSSDGTLELLRAAHAADERIRVLSFSRNFGKEAALSAGLDHVRGEAVVPIDVDMQDPPEVLGAMIEKWREGFEVVYGVRSNREKDSPAKRISAHFFYRAHNRMSNDKIPEHAGDFRLLDRKVVDVLRADARAQSLHEGHVRLGGLPPVGDQYIRQTRQAGRPSSATGSCGRSRSTGSRRRSTVPLRVWSYVGARHCDRSPWRSPPSSFARTLIFGTDVPGLCIADRRGAFPRRPAAALARHHRRICGPDP